MSPSPADRMPAAPRWLGDSAILLEWNSVADDRAAPIAQAFADSIRRELGARVLDVVPALRTVAVHFDPLAVAGEELLTQLAAIVPPPRRRRESQPILEIPVCYDPEFGLDLHEIAAQCGLPADEIVRLHWNAVYEVQFIGFLPGFAYLTGLPLELHLPRRATPRPRVAAGSVGIGGRQTGVYPFESPGGWWLVGRTDVTLFDPTRDKPARLAPGQPVRFRPVGRDELSQGNAW